MKMGGGRGKRWDGSLQSYFLWWFILISTSLNWEIPRLESALSRCLWRCFLRGLEPKTLLEWGLTIPRAGDLEPIKPGKRELPAGESPLSLTPSPLLPPPKTSLLPVHHEVSNSAPPYGLMTSNIAVVVSISTTWKSWSLRNREPKQILLAEGVRQRMSN